MTSGAAVDATTPASHLDVVLSRLGRASTPDVPASPSGVTLGALMGLGGAVKGNVVLLIGCSSLHHALRTVATVEVGIPGLLVEQAELDGVNILVIDWHAFEFGPWQWANRHEAKALADEIFDAGRALRASGGMVLGIPIGGARSLDAYLVSTCTVDMTAVDPIDLEERAPQSAVWQVVGDFAARGCGHEGLSG